jgi:hypothetical protein
MLILIGKKFKCPTVPSYNHFVPDIIKLLSCVLKTPCVKILPLVLSPIFTFTSPIGACGGAIGEVEFFLHAKKNKALIKMNIL